MSYIANVFEEWDACSDSLKWLRSLPDMTAAEMWNRCPDPEWRKWAARELRWRRACGDRDAISISVAIERAVFEEALRGRPTPANAPLHPSARWTLDALAKVGTNYGAGGPP